MLKGFAIFRDPALGEIKGWRGEFKAYKPEPGCIDPRFLIKPWDYTTPPQVLDVTEMAENFTEFGHWLEEMELRVAGKTHDVNKEEFIMHLNFIKTGIVQDDFEKVVASRSDTHEGGINDIESVFLKACADYPESFVSLVYHPGWGCWLGATPERFATTHNHEVEINAVAGTLIGNDKQWTQKEKLEQSVIEKYLLELLQARGIEPNEVNAKSVIAQGNVKHLASSIKFNIKPEDFSSFLREMHPTPAVCGYPKQQALMFIERFENLERELYSGWLGWSENGEFHSWVNLRCCRIYKDKVRFFAGCGINSQSDPAKEWLETEAKLDILRLYLLNQ